MKTELHDCVFLCWFNFFLQLNIFQRLSSQSHLKYNQSFLQKGNLQRKERKLWLAKSRASLHRHLVRLIGGRKERKKEEEEKEEKKKKKKKKEEEEEKTNVTERRNHKHSMSYCL